MIRPESTHDAGEADRGEVRRRGPRGRRAGRRAEDDPAADAACLSGQMSWGDSDTPTDRMPSQAGGGRGREQAGLKGVTWRPPGRLLLVAVRPAEAPPGTSVAGYAAMLMLWDSWIPSIRSRRLCIARRCSSLPKRSASVRSTTWPAFP
jgi:hypothetical protein